jgi:hypothetical protein
MTPKPKVEVAREHLAKAQEEADGGDLRDAVQWAFASLEAAIDALSIEATLADIVTAVEIAEAPS